MRSTPETRKPCTLRLYSVTITKHSASSGSGRMPMAWARSITEMVWPRRLATPRTLGSALTMRVSPGHWITSRTLNTLMPKR